MIDKHLDILQRYFGFPQTIFDEYVFTQSAKGFYCVPKSTQPPAKLKVDATGIFFLKTKTLYPKLSTAAAQLFGKQATNHVVTLANAAERDAYLKRESQQLALSQWQGDEPTGFVMVQYDNLTLGLGLAQVARDRSGLKLTSLFPSHY